MLKEKYKACFDDIEGEAALLDKILSKADVTEKSLKRIQLIRYTKYAASVAAAFVVVISSAFLYNNGFFATDINEKDRLELKTVQNKSDNNANNNSSDKAVLYENRSENEESVEGIEYKAEKNADEKYFENKGKAKSIKENNAVKKSYNSGSADSIEKSVASKGDKEESFVLKTETDHDEKNSENILTYSNEAVNSENIEYRERSTENKSEDISKNEGKGEEIVSAEAVTGDKETGAESEKIRTVSGGGGGASAVPAVTAVSEEKDNSAESSFAAYDVADLSPKNSGGSGAGKKSDRKLAVFREGIMNIPEREYSDESKKILVYTNEEKTKRIEITFIRKNGEAPRTAENVFLIENEDRYVTVKAENISDDYLEEIISYFVDK